MKKIYTFILINLLLISNSIEAIAEEFYREEETAQLSAESIVETTASTESFSDIHEIEKNEDSSDRILSEEVNYMTDNSSLKNTNDSTRSLGGQTGRWFVINEKNLFFSPTLNIVKDTIYPIVFLK